MVVILAALATLVFSLLLPKEYQAEAKFFTNLAQQYRLQSSNENTNAQAAQFELEAQLNTISEQLTSRQVLSLLAYKLILHDLTSREEAFKNVSVIQRSFSVAEVREAQQFYQTRLDSLQPLTAPIEGKSAYLEILKLMHYDINSLLEDLNVSRTPGSDIFRITFVSQNPRLSAFAVNALCKEFFRYYEFQHIETLRNAIGFYTENSLERKAELRETISKQQDFVEIIDNQQDAAKARSLLIRLRNLEILHSEEERRIRSLENALRSINDRMTTDEPSNKVSKTYIDALNISREKIEQYHSRLIDQIAQGKPYERLEDTLNMALQRMDNQLYQYLRSSIANQRSIDERLYLLQKDRMKAQENARNRLMKITNNLEDIRGMIFAGNARPTVVTTQNNEVKAASRAYFEVLEQLFEARYFGLNDDSQLGHIDYASVPEEPVSSKRWLHVGISSVLSFTLCVLTLIALEALDSTIKTGSHFEHITGMHLLSNLNYLNADRLDLIALFSDTTLDPYLEAYKHLMRKIRFEIISSGAVSFLITSTRPGAGKTSLLFSLSYALSLNHKKILLIDTNFKNNQLTRMTSANPTLERYMADEIGYEELVSPSGLDQIYILGCEGGNYTPSEIFVPPSKFINLIDNLSKTYDYIFLEGPALNLYSGSRELEQFVEKVIPVFSAKSAIKQPDKLSVKYLKSLDDKLMGSILNKVDLEDLEE